MVINKVKVVGKFAGRGGVKDEERPEYWNLSVKIKCILIIITLKNVKFNENFYCFSVIYDVLEALYKA
jgi:hypothetical protein